MRNVEGGEVEDIRVLVVDDHQVVRQGLRSLLSQYPDIQVVGEAEDGRNCLQLAGSLRPDVILLDIRLADCNGLDLARRLRRAHQESRVIMLTSYDDEAYLLQAAQAGVHGYLLKSAFAEVLASTIRAVHKGEMYLAPAMGGKALAQLEKTSQSLAQSNAGLSRQELQLLRLIADGASATDIADQLGLSDRTVKRRTQDILDKLGAASRAHAVSEAYERGLF